MDQQNKHHNGETLIDFLMTNVLPVVGGSIGIIIVQQLTGWPFLVCVIVGFVAGVVVAWGTVAGLMYLLDRIFKSK